MQGQTLWMFKKKIVNLADFAGILAFLIKIGCFVKYVGKNEYSYDYPKYKALLLA